MYNPTYIKLKEIAVLVFILFMSNLHGQKEQYLMLELGGSGGLASLNYEKGIYEKRDLRLFYRTGFSYFPIDRNNGSALIFPQMIHGVYGKNIHFVDLGIGLAPSFTTTFGGVYVRMPVSLGYRIAPKEKNYYLRLSYTPIISFLIDFQWEHWAGISFAYRLSPKRDKL